MFVIFRHYIEIICLCKAKMMVKYGEVGHLEIVNSEIDLKKWT